MNTKQLRQKILDLAIHGKIVPQDPNDEPASVLLERVRAEKEKLIKEGKIKRDKNDSTISHSDDKSHYEQLPPGWTWATLGELAFYKKGPFGSSITKEMFIPYSETAIKVYEQKNAIKKDAEIGNYYISTEKFEELKGFEVFEDDIIVSCAGTIGETFVMPKGMRKGVINQALMRVSLYDKSIMSYYLIYFDAVLKQSAQIESKGSAIKNIPPLEVLKQFPVALPPIVEQQRIAATIESAFSIIDKIERDKEGLQTAIAATKSQILSLAISGKLVPQDPTDEPASALLERIRAEKETLVKAGKIKCEKSEGNGEASRDNSYYVGLPESWTICRVDDIGSTNIGLTYKPTDICDNGVPVLRSNNIKAGRLDFSELVRVNTSLNENLELNDGDILICARNGSRSLVGKCALVHGLSERMTFGAFMAIYRSICNHYIYYFLHTDNFRAIFQSEGISTQINQLTQAMIRQTLIPLPPLAEQERIVDAIEVAFEELDNITASLA